VIALGVWIIAIVSVVGLGIKIMDGWDG